MVWPDGKPEKRSAGKERRQRTPADVAFIFRGTSAQKPNRLNEAANKRVPRRMERFRRGEWTAGKEPYTDPRLSPRACLTRQAGFTAARPAANWIRAVAESSCAAVRSLAVSARLCLARRVGAELRQDADCAPEDASGGFPRCTARK